MTSYSSTEKLVSRLNFSTISALRDLKKKNLLLSPNGWNCRCYTIPLTPDEVADSGISPESPTDIAKVNKVAGEGGVYKEFTRNTGMIHSIWGKWLTEKMSGKDYKKITEWMRDYINKPVNENVVLETINNPIDNFSSSIYSDEDFKREFPNRIAKTPLGELKIGDYQFSKLVEQGRLYLGNSLKKLLTAPDIMLIDTQGGVSTMFLKSFRKDNRTVFVSAVHKQKDDKSIFVSLSEKSLNRISNIVKASKLIVYVRPMLAAGSANADGNQFTLPTGRFNQENINKNYGIINEAWGEIIQKKERNIAVIRIINYKVEGFRVRVTGDRGVKEVEVGYDEIDTYRKGVILNIV